MSYGQSLVASLQQTIQRLERESAKLEKTLASNERNSTCIRHANTNLQLEIKKLTPRVNAIRCKREELRQWRLDMEESSKTREQMQTRVEDLQQKNSDLHDKLESLQGDMSALRRDRQADKEDITSLRRLKNGLEREMELGEWCLLQQDELMERKNAATQELISAVHEYSEHIDSLTERKAELELEMKSATEKYQAPVQKPRTLYEELEEAMRREEATPVASEIAPAAPLTDPVHEATPEKPVASESVPDGSVVDDGHYCRRPALLNAVRLPALLNSFRMPAFLNSFRMPAVLKGFSMSALDGYGIPTLINGISFSLGFWFTIYFFLMLVTTFIMPQCHAGGRLECRDLLTQALPSAMKPYSQVTYLRPPPF
ncbi:coiled-coil domain-containing protein 102A-like [Engraulis encrasicolus]|uniref:coiled-coil domain-containing protein 102A-like n=1 Tax=Engraulis encrasicolus TaxID=184585 RepID=UPI002FD0C687